jgi:CRP-like cAMP-binding protein
LDTATDDQQPGGSAIPGGALPCETCDVRLRGFCNELLGATGPTQPFVDNGLSRKFWTARPRELLFDPDTLREQVYAVCEGWAFRLRRLRDGRRHILSFLIPGDIVYGIYTENPAYRVQALTPVRYCQFDPTEIGSHLRSQPKVFEAWIAIQLAERSRLAAMAGALCQFDAAGRVAQLVSQLKERLDGRGLSDGQTCEFPLRQSHIADATGLTTVHVNRTLAVFRKQAIFSIEAGKLTIFDANKLRRIAEGG